MVKEAEQVTTGVDVKSSQNGKHSRRTFFKKAVVTGVGIGVGEEVVRNWGSIWRFIRRSGEGIRKVSTAKDALDKIFSSLSSEQELLRKVYRKGVQINLETLMSQFPEGLDIEVFGMGDSNFYQDGEKNDTPGSNGLATPDDQPHSFLEQAGDSMQSALPQLGIRSWKTHTYAVPGAPSGTGYDGEQRKYGLIGPEQIGNPDFQERLRKGNQLKIVNIGVHGDDWRQLATDAFELAALFKTLDLNNLDKISDQQIAELKQLKARSDKIAADYGTHVGEALTTIAQINEERLSKGLPAVRVVVNYPISAHGVDHIPFRTITGDEQTHPELSKVVKEVPGKKDRYYLDLNEIPRGKDIAYIITDSIYKQLSTVLPQVAQQHPKLDIYSVVWMGIEKQKDAFYIDGHLNGTGIQRVAKLFLHLFKKQTVTGTEVTLDKISPL